MYGRSLQCLNSKIYARNAQSQPFNFQISGKSPYFQNSFFCLIEYISVSINATDAYYTSNDWKLSQLFAEPSRFELRGLHEELEALKQFSFFPPDLKVLYGFSVCIHPLGCDHNISYPSSWFALCDQFFVNPLSPFFWSFLL